MSSPDPLAAAREWLATAATLVEPSPEYDAWMREGPAHVRALAAPPSAPDHRLREAAQAVIAAWASAGRVEQAAAIIRLDAVLSEATPALSPSDPLDVETTALVGAVEAVVGAWLVPHVNKPNLASAMAGLHAQLLAWRDAHVEPEYDPAHPDHLSSKADPEEPGG